MPKTDVGYTGSTHRAYRYSADPSPKHAHAMSPATEVRIGSATADAAPLLHQQFSVGGIARSTACQTISCPSRRRRQRRRL